ncbi:MAG: DUF1993 domain-containing protein [Deltaproteobacteria bacterium]|nr:DUF1993 domain-containing protein [Deltaproteobacteria bacterium]
MTSTYFSTVKQMNSTLGALEGWLDEATTFAKSKNDFDPNVLLSMRLAPDQYALVRQIQAACDAAKFCAARTANKDAPTHPDEEKTLDEIRARVRSVRAYLGTFVEGDFEGAESRVVPLSFMPGKGMAADDYVRQMATPNFYFHVSMAYAILRHTGVNLGKRHFITELALRDL